MNKAMNRSFPPKYQRLSACWQPVAITFLILSGAPCYAQQPAAAPQSLTPRPAMPVENPSAPLKKSPTAQDLPLSLKGRPLSIRDVVALALAVNPSLVSAKESWRESQGNTKTVGSNQGLSVSATGTLGYYNKQQAQSVGSQSFITEKQGSQTYDATVSLPIDIFGELKAATDQAKFQEIASRLNVLSEQNTVVLNVKSAFYDVLRDKALVTVAQTDLQNAQANLTDAMQRYSAGTTTRYDVVSAQATVSSDQQSLLSAQNTLAVAFATLNNDIGVDIDTQIQLTTEGAVDVPENIDVSLSDLPEKKAIAPRREEPVMNFKPGEQIGDNGSAQANLLENFVVSNASPLGSDYDKLVKEAIKSRPEIMQEEATVAAARKGIYLARKSGLPSVSVGYTQTYNPTSATSTGINTGETTLSLSIPIFDSGYVAGKVTQARASLSSAETARRQQIDSVILEVRKAYMTLQESLAELKSARMELAKADEGYRLARLRYSAGTTSSSYTSPLLELSDAQSTLSTAQKDYVNALYDYNNDRCSLDKAIGRYSAEAK